VAARSKARNVFALSNTGVVDLNPNPGMDVCPRFVRPSWALNPGLTDRLVVGRKVTLTLTLTLGQPNRSAMERPRTRDNIKHDHMEMLGVV
jgi:hypothetical protein